MKIFVEKYHFQMDSIVNCRYLSFIIPLTKEKRACHQTKVSPNSSNYLYYILVMSPQEG
jgi:hypothetical protein